MYKPESIETEELGGGLFLNTAVIYSLPHFLTGWKITHLS